jgi:hypothetical protein
MGNQHSKLYMALPDDRSSGIMVECVNGAGDQLNARVIGNLKSFESP